MMQNFIKDQTNRLAELTTRMRECEQKLNRIRDGVISPSTSDVEKMDRGAEKPEGLLVDGKHKTLINYVPKTEFEAVCQSLAEQFIKVDE